MSISISEDSAGWLLGENCRALIFLKSLCHVSMEVPRRRGHGGRTVLISGSLRNVSKAGQIVKLDVREPHLLLTDEGVNRLRKDRSRVEDR